MTVTLITLTACSATGPKPTLNRAVPEAPTFMRPVAIPTVKAGKLSKKELASVAAKFAEANKRLEASCLWYNGTVKSSFGGLPMSEETKKICLIP